MQTAILQMLQPLFIKTFLSANWILLKNPIRKLSILLIDPVRLAPPNCLISPGTRIHHTRIGTELGLCCDGAATERQGNSSSLRQSGHPGSRYTAVLTFRNFCHFVDQKLVPQINLKISLVVQKLISLLLKVPPGIVALADPRGRRPSLIWRITLFEVS